MPSSARARMLIHTTEALSNDRPTERNECDLQQSSLIRTGDFDGRDRIASGYVRSSHGFWIAPGVGTKTETRLAIQYEEL